MSVCLCADFSLVKDGKTIYNGYSEHCYFTREDDHLKTQFEMQDGFILNDDQGTRVTEFFNFSLESVSPAEVGEVIVLLTQEIPCLIMFNGWWEIYVPIQYVGSLSLVH